VTRAKRGNGPRSSLPPCWPPQPSRQPPPEQTEGGCRLHAWRAPHPQLREGGRGLVAGVHDLVQGRGVRELAPPGPRYELPEALVVGGAPGLGGFPDDYVRVPVSRVVPDRPVQAVRLVP